MLSKSRTTPSNETNISHAEEKGRAERTRRRIDRERINDEEYLALLKPANIRERS